MMIFFFFLLRLQKIGEFGQADEITDGRQDRKLESKQIVTCVTINNRNEL